MTYSDLSNYFFLRNNSYKRIIKDLYAYQLSTSRTLDNVHNFVEPQIEKDSQIINFIKNAKSSLDIQNFREKETCTVSKELFQPLRLLFLKVCHPVRLLRRDQSNLERF